MCNKYGYNAPHHRLREIFAQQDLPFRWPEAAPNLAPLEEINPTDPAPVIRPYEDGVRLDQMRWGFPPPRPKAGPVINFRSENRRFTHGRCYRDPAIQPFALNKVAIIEAAFLKHAEPELLAHIRRRLAIENKHRPKPRPCVRSKQPLDFRHFHSLSGERPAGTLGPRSLCLWRASLDKGA